MTSIKLPKLKRIVFQQSGCKNKITQLIAQPIDLSINIAANNKNHILMARCATKEKAQNIFELYIGKESQQVNPKITDSIQYRVIDELKKENFDIIYDDDYSGEIADIITIKFQSNKLSVGLFHLKFAIDGKVSGQVKNLYEVCGQTQKSVHWKHKEGKEFINHLLRRETKVKNGQECSRLEVGTKKDLEKLLSIAKQKIPMEFEIYIVQPGFSKVNATNEILTLLGVTDMYLKDYAGINLKVIAS